MIKILRMEFFRLKKFKTFFVLLGVVVLLKLLSFLIVLGSSWILTGETSLWSGTGLLYIKTISSLGSTTDLLALICTAVFLSREFSDGPIRNAILSNKSRTTIYFSYGVVALFIGVVFCLTEYIVQVALFSTLGFAVSLNVVLRECFETFIVSLFLTIFSQSSVVLFLFCTRKTATTIILPVLVAQIAPVNIASILLSLAEADIIKENAIDWLPFLNVTMFENLTEPSATLVLQILMYLVPLSALFVYLGWNSFRKADLK